MYILALYPLQSCLSFLIAPTIGGIVMYLMAKNESNIDKKYSRTLRGIVFGLIIDIPFLCFILWAGSSF